MVLSIVVVCLNAGIDLIKTINSILQQNANDYEVIVKDGGSEDGSLEKLPISDKICVISQKDTGVYDAMNQAIDYVSGEYVLFMNCGDTFHSRNCINIIYDSILPINNCQTIFYGNCYVVNRRAVIQYPKVFSNYTCFSKTICHQAMVFPKKLFDERRYQTKYKICADFEYYIHAYCNGYKLVQIPYVIVNYKGNGMSEILQNRRKAIVEKKQILRANFSSKIYCKNWIKAQLHGMGIKQWLAGSKYFYKMYSQMAGFIYRNMR